MPIQAVTRIGNQNFAYDRNGNLTEQAVAGSGWLHDWDWKDRLAVSRHFVPDPLEERQIDQEIRYAYDEQKQRILKNDITNDELTVYIDRYFDREGDVEKAYVYAGEIKIASLEITPNGEEQESRLIFHHSDHLTGGNVDTNEEGEIVQLLDYFPYGATRIDESAEGYENDYGFTGKELDEETSLNYFEARYYDSRIGRFISYDPAVHETLESFLEDPQQLNPYSYARNNPMRYTDPSGQSIDDIRQQLNDLYARALDLQRRINELAANNRAVAGGVIAAEIAPGTGDVNDFYSAIFGRSLFTGQQLSPTERVLSAGGALLPFVTGGVLVKVGGEIFERGGKSLIKSEIDDFIKNVTKKSNGETNRIVKSDTELKSIFDRIGIGGKDVTSPNYDGKMVQLPDGLRIGLRNHSASGGRAIDIHSPNGGIIYKIHIQK